MKKLSVCFLMVLGLAGCSKYASNGEHLYMMSRNGPKLVVPPPLTSANLSSFYILPEQTASASVSIIPPG